MLTVAVTACAGKRPPTAPPPPPAVKPVARVDTLLLEHAPSLEQPLAILATRFQAAHPGVVVQRRRARADLAQPAGDASGMPDVLAVEGAPRATWYVVFARDALVLACTDRSAFAADIAPANWADVLLRPGARVGRADPRDPAGYRALLLFRLAALHYARPGLVAVLERASTTAIPAPHRTLLDALTAGALDYVVTYRSLARARGFRAVELPDAINLGDPTRSAFYARASIAVPLGPGAAESLIRGEPILYGATVPPGARHEALGEQLVRALRSAEGRELLAEWGFLVPVSAIEAGPVPATVRPPE